MREAEIAHTVRERRIGEYLALDQDKASLKLIEKNYARFGVTTIEGSVRGILTGKHCFENFDFVYASGLFDYLSQPIGQKLVEHMFEAVRPGGEMLIANFLPMLIFGALVTTMFVLGILPFFLGLLVAMPIFAIAHYVSYRELFREAPEP